MNRPSRLPALAAALVLLAGCADKTRVGETIAVPDTIHVCAACHGSQGRSISPEFPNLAGQQKDYLVVQLQAFRDHTRGDPHAHTYMWGMAARLDDPTIEGIASFFAKQTPATPVAADPAAIEAGRKLFAEGAPSHDVPACSGCHGETAQGNSQIPRLASQNREYLLHQLGYFQTNQRANEMMHQVSQGLTPAEIEAAVAFASSQK